MPTFIIKPDRDQDFYVAWSSIVDAPTAWGDRDEVARAVADYDGPGEAKPDRFDRADRHGSSARFGSPPTYGYEDGEFLVHNMPGSPATIARDRMIEWLQAGCPASMLTPLPADTETP